MYESRHQQLSSTPVFLSRLYRSVLWGFIIIALSLCLGMMGYRYLEKMSWPEAFENAAMILSGMGPIKDLKTTEGKIFAGLYALFSGVVFLIVIGVVFAPVIHRFLHRFHLEEDKKSLKF